MLNLWHIWKSERLKFVNNHLHYVFYLIFKSNMPAQSLWCFGLCLFKENMETFVYQCGMLKNVPRRGSWKQYLWASNSSCLLSFRAPDSQALLRNVQRWVESVLKSEKMCVSAYLPQRGDCPLFKGQPSIVFGSSCSRPSDITGSVGLRSLQTWLLAGLF